MHQSQDLILYPLLSPVLTTPLAFHTWFQLPSNVLRNSMSHGLSSPHGEVYAGWYKHMFSEGRIHWIHDHSRLFSQLSVHKVIISMQIWKPYSIWFFTWPSSSESFIFQRPKWFKFYFIFPPFCQQPHTRWDDISNTKTQGERGWTNP